MEGDIDIVCANCGDLIETVEKDSHVLGLFQHRSKKGDDEEIVDTGGCSACRYGD